MGGSNPVNHPDNKLQLDINILARSPVQNVSLPRLLLVNVNDLNYISYGLHTQTELIDIRNIAHFCIAPG